MNTVAGVDISATTAHVVVLDGSASIVDAALWAADNLGPLADRLALCDVVAIDSPDRWSSGPIPEHADLSPKFIAARCAEWELARTHYWVPWVTPLPPKSDAEHQRYAWIERGIELFKRLEGRTTPIEVYPNSVFKRLAGTSPLLPKSTSVGLTSRAALLRAEGVVEVHLGMWSHDSLDAAAAAVVALHHSRGIAVEVSCGHDGSAMWLPRSPLPA
jgi:predicted nuclease with RNAse H fold